jgi:hypothetical protein
MLSLLKTTKAVPREIPMITAFCPISYGYRKICAKLEDIPGRSL